ncbi:MAG: hypothetical protein M3P91_10450 [Actinomycetota bacterium]|nr:hypothetical protein [Actinomycetota bacterium]
MRLKSTLASVGATALIGGVLVAGPAAAGGGETNQHHKQQSQGQQGKQGNGQQGQQGNGQQGGGRHNMHSPSNFKMVSTQHVHMWMKDGHMVVGNKHDRNNDGKLCAREIGQHKHVVKDNMKN